MCRLKKLNLKTNSDFIFLNIKIFEFSIKFIALFLKLLIFGTVTLLKKLSTCFINLVKHNFVCKDELYSKFCLKIQNIENEA